MEKEAFEIRLDSVDYDIVIFGTGLVESVLSAYFAKANKKILVLDIDDTYASSLKTVSFKELRNLIVNKEEVSLENFKKNIFFSNWEENVFSEEELQKENMRYFNIDLQPKLLFSESITADMDKYMDFRAICGIFHWDEANSKFISCPCSKGDIFKNSDLSLLEKRELFQLLQTLSEIFKKMNKIEIDPNSTAEFDKEVTINEKELALFEEFSDKPAELYFEKKKISKRVQDICLYTIGNFENSNKKSLKEFIERISRFVRSIGIHSEFPYLYTNYGSGDIPQGYSRIAAVYGTVFIIHKGMKIEKIEKEEKMYKIYSNLSEENRPIVCKEIIGGTEYQDAFEKIGLQNEEEKINCACLRCFYFIKKEENRVFFDCPRFYVIPPKSKVNNSQPINLFFLTNSSNSTPKNFLLILGIVFLSQEEEKDLEFQRNIRENLASLIKENVNVFEENNENFEYFYKASCLQKGNETKKSIWKNGILIIKNEEISVDLDKAFEEFREIARQYDTELFAERIDDPFATKKEKNLDYEEEGEINDLIKNIEKLKNN